MRARYASTSSSSEHHSAASRKVVSIAPPRSLTTLRSKSRFHDTLRRGRRRRDPEGASRASPPGKRARSPQPPLNATENPRSTALRGLAASGGVGRCRVVHAASFAARADSPGGSALGWRVGQVDDVRGEGPRICKLQGRPLLALSEEAFAAQDQRMHEELELVEHSALEQGAGESAAAGDNDVLSRLALEIRDPLGELVALDQRRVLPREGLLEAVRDAVLGEAVHERGNGF